VKEKEIEDELVSIRSMMERSSKFISLSGLSGILAGVYALVGAAVAYYIIYIVGPDYLQIRGNTTEVKGLFYGGPTDAVFNRYYGMLYFGFLINSKKLLLIGVVVLIASIGSGIILTMRKAKRKGQAAWGKISRLLLFNMAVPLFTGGIFIIFFVIHLHYDMIIPTSLVFYGLSLVSASNFTFSDVKYLGLCEIFIGIFAACLPTYGLLFWAIGFGVLHIIYGSMMYFKYDR
jgi:hypothetical protein